MDNTFPPEILDLISQEIRDRRSLFSLSLVSKVFYEVFNRRLYEEVDSYSKGQMRTVALSQSERMPLCGPHPASFVKALQLSSSGYYDDVDDNVDDNDHREQENLQRTLSFRRQVISAWNNIANHHAVLRRLEVDFPRSDIDSFHEVLGVNWDQCSFLEELVIRCAILKKECLYVFVSLKQCCLKIPAVNSFAGVVMLQLSVFEVLDIGLV